MRVLLETGVFLRVELGVIEGHKWPLGQSLPAIVLEACECFSCDVAGGSEKN